MSHRGRNGTGLRLFALLVCPSLAAPAHAEDAKPPHWYDLITLNAFVSTSWEFNFNRPPSGQNGYRAFDYDHNSFRIDAAEVVLQKPVANPGDFGFRLDVTYGAVARVAAARGLFRDPATGNALDIDLQQAIASYIIPLGRGLRVDAGKFVTPVGYELIEGYDGYNDNFSHSYLFTYGPYTHTGLRFSYPFTDKFNATVMLINGWDNVVDNNQAKSFGVTLAFVPHPTLNLFLNYVAGPEQDKNDDDFRHLVDFVGVWKPNWRFALTLNVDYGLDTNAVVLAPADGMMVIDPAHAARKNAQWVMAVVYLRTALTHRLALILRGELFRDDDGNRTGTAQTLGALTLTPELRINDNLLLRGEFRYDQSDQRVFERSDGAKTRKYQDTVALNLVFAI
jgi:hypothetical protein